MKLARGRDFVPASSLHSDGRRNYVQPADVSGRFTRLRHACFGMLIGVYAALPWIQIGGRPAVLLDIPNREFYLFGLSFAPQDLWLFFFVLSGIGFSLFVITTVLGRVWCGYACPQTVFLEAIYRRIERLIEGDRAARLRRNAGPWTRDKLWRKIMKQAAFLLCSFVIAHIFISYFVSVPRMWALMKSGPAANPSVFLWSLAITALVHFNYAWFREQLCLVICPYGRLQSTMTDADTLIIVYDQKRGEPRGKKSDVTAGDCVNCGRCVAVCPTGIDIRNGLQMDCIGCAACIDACDEIMHKVGQKPGLVRYDSQRGLTEGRQRFWRPRLALYAVLGLIGLILASFSFARRRPLEANLVRLEGQAFQTQNDEIRNGFEIRLTNKTKDQQTVELVGSGPLHYTFARNPVVLAPMTTETVPVFVVRKSRSDATDVSIDVTSTADPKPMHLGAKFVGPRRRPK